MLSQADAQSIGARHSATPTMTAAMAMDAIVLGVRRRLVSEGGASLISGSPRTSVVVTAPTVPRGSGRLRGDDRRATGPRSGRTRRTSHSRQQRPPRRDGPASCDGPLALCEHPGELVELRMLVALIRRTAVPLTDLVHALERRIGERYGPQLGGAGLHDSPDTAMATEMDVRANGGAQHRTIDEVERGAVPARHLRLGRGGFRISDEDLTDGAHREQRSLAVLIDRPQLGVEDREIKGDLRRIGEHYLTVDEIDDDDGHRESVTFRSQVQPDAIVGSIAEVTC